MKKLLFSKSVSVFQCGVLCLVFFVFGALVESKIVESLVESL